MGRISKTKEQRQRAWEEFGIAYYKEPDVSAFNKEYQLFPYDEKKIFEVAKELFENAFQSIIDKYHLVEAYKFKNDLDIVELSRVLLPEAFNNIEIKEEAIIDTIERCLRNINEKNRELSRRKLQKIQDLLEQVRDEISNSVEFARRIDLFLNNQEREITGGYRARLKSEFSKGYPKG